MPGTGPVDTAGTSRRTHVKRRSSAPPGFFAAEAAGLAWLAAAAGDAGGVPVVDVLAVEPDAIVLARLDAVPPTRAAAEQFGRRLAETHRAGAGWFGCPPDAWTGDGWIGDAPMSFSERPASGGAGRAAGWGPFFAEHRLLPYARRAHELGRFGGSGLAAVQDVCERLHRADEALTGPPEPPSRLHGDLWSGNVLWTAGGAVLLDPAAHGGHRETDLAMLALFGLPHLEAVLAAYDAAAPLAPGWRHRVGLHQLFPVLVHALLFGGGYGEQATAAARRYTS